MPNPSRDEDHHLNVSYTILIIEIFGFFVNICVLLDLILEWSQK
jgi:preprotein translocase subunit SecE